MKLFIQVMIMFAFRSFAFSQENLQDPQVDTLLIQQDTIPQDTIPQDTIPQDTIPQDTVPQDTTPAPPDTVQQDTTRQPPTPSEDTTQIPKEVKNLINNRSMEIGLMFGEPTGVTYKYFITDANAVHAAAAVTFIPDAAFQLNVDFLRHYFRFSNVGGGRLPLIYGAGLAVQFRDETRWGIRIPVGLTYLMENLPLSLFVHVAPRFDIVPDTEVSINASVGIRYRFFPR